MSKLLIRLQAEHATATDALRGAELQARIAGHLARLGRFDEARASVLELRKSYGDGHSGRVTAWIMLAEGLIHHYSDLNPMALERITGARALGIAMRHTEIVALTSAWKAHVEFETSRFGAMVESLAFALAHAAEHDHDAQARIAIVLCNSFMICGQPSLAQKWFMRGRDHALKNGDQPSIEAMLYNRAAFGVCWLRAQACERELDAADFASLRTEVASARNLQHLTRITALTNHIHLWECRLLMLERHFERAIESLHAVRSQSPFAAYNFNGDLIAVEVCHCLVQLQRKDEAWALYLGIDEHSFAGLDIDERMAVAWMQWQMSLADGRFGDPAARRGQLAEHLAAYHAARAALARDLQPFAAA